MKKEQKKKVLIVDDDDNLRKILKETLEKSGYHLLEARDGEEGLKTALKNRPDIIVLDVLMPIMNGWDMLRTLRKDEWGKTAKVIMLTVLEDADSVAKAMQDGSFFYLIKTGVDMKDIIDKVEEIIRS